ncbi:MAG: YiiX/YebB-like N1pC/P60 family cysteine hydrolase [Alcanivoracaceae bacterium]|nr:YiiX/YebB-like N1pC/P60 family cysteine hydrolase [Alcanivoracaceae bacterium]
MPQTPLLADVDPRDIAESLKTGDLLFFSGRGLASDVVRMFTRSYWSHIGIVVRLRGISEPLVLESTTLSDSNDLLRGRPVNGIGLVPFRNKISEYQGDVALRRFDGPSLTPPKLRMVERLALRLCHRPYKNYVLCHVRGYLAGYPGKDYSAMFCSELVAEMYRRIGWLKREIQPNSFVPGNFAADDLPLTGGRLEKMVRLKPMTEDLPLWAEREATLSVHAAAVLQKTSAVWAGT